MPKNKILIVDDNEEIAELTKKFLERRGYEVKAALSAIAGLELLNNDSFDVLVSDINMPEMDGEEFVRRAKILDPSLGIILITGFVCSDITTRVSKLGIHECLNKPVGLDKLCASIESALKAAGTKKKA